MLLRIFRTAIFLGSIWWACFHWCHGCQEDERTNLLLFKDSINYPHGSFLDRYWIGKNCCQWERIKCNPFSSRVVFLDLGFVRDQRSRLWYPNASLFTPFKELEHLSLYGNQIGGWVMPQAFSNMQSLKILSLGSNNLSADIDSLQGICKLTALRSLDLAANGLNDNGIPKCLSNLSLLEELYLWRNELSGAFSSLTGFCGLSALRTLDLGSNNINDNDGGSLSICLGNFSLLENLYLYDNNLTSFFGKSKPGLKQLQKLFLSSNHMTDDSISPWIYNLTSLTTLLLGDNRLSNSNTMRD